MAPSRKPSPNPKRVETPSPGSSSFHAKEKALLSCPFYRGETKAQRDDIVVQWQSWCQSWDSNLEPWLL